MRNHGSQDQPLSIITNSVQKLMQRTNHHSHMLRTSLFILARRPEVESRKAFSQVVNSATKYGSGVFKFKTSWAITAGKKILGEWAFSCYHCQFPNGLGSSKIKESIHGPWAFISDYAKYFIQRAHLQRLRNLSKEHQVTKFCPHAVFI